MKKSSNFLVGIMAGVAAGAAVALILTPKKSRETIGQRASRLRNRAGGVTDNLRGMASCPVTAVRDTFRRSKTGSMEESVADLPNETVAVDAVDENVSETETVHAEIATQDSETVAVDEIAGETEVVHAEVANPDNAPDESAERT